jgi:dihydroorotate dehydrogenase (NAD+) catalytic subunit
MVRMLLTPFYDPEKSYEDNFKYGPFGAFSDGKVILDEGEPKYDFFGHKVFSPFGIPAGPLINGKFTQAALDKGFDIVIYKTVRTKEYPSHPWPNVLAVKVPPKMTLGKEEAYLVADHHFTEPLSITNSFGVPSFSPEFWQKDIAEVQKNLRKGQILIGAFQRTKEDGKGVEEYINDFVKAAHLMKETGVQVMEVNFSCPNEGTSELLCYDVVRSAEVIKAIKKEIGNIPLIVKISYYKDEGLLNKFVKEVGSLVQGIAAINTIYAQILDENGKSALPGRTHSGVCGSAIKGAGLEMVRRLKDLREKLKLSYTIIGVGGVVTPEDFFEYRRAGADIVMSATGAMWNPYLAKKIKEELGSIYEERHSNTS